MFPQHRTRLATAVPLLASLLILASVSACQNQDPFYPTYQTNCASCHGERLEGLPIGPALVGDTLLHGDTVDELVRSIAQGYPERGMPPFAPTLSEAEIRRLAIFIADTRRNYSMLDYKVSGPLVIPDSLIESEIHTFRLEPVATGLHPLPYSIALLPDGRILLTEKMRGLTIISPDGTQSALIQQTPKAYAGGYNIPGTELKLGLGWMLEVALHPDYAENGWIYLSYGDRCSDCNTMSRETGDDVSMTALVRGRIHDGVWVDEEIIWRADLETYTSMPDMTAAGRIAFDDAGHVFLSIGFKGPTNYWGIQDLSLPYGKIHRMYDDGRIPENNPFVNTPNAMPSIWTYGHRNPQGLAFHKATGHLWSTEMGPRGGDEVNLLLPGKNYGWPLYSKGLNYDGTPVDYGNILGITVDLATIEQPVVDLTPAPAVSSLIVYDGTRFENWQGNLIVGTLKATTLYRMVLNGDRVIQTEILLKDVARIRDVEVGSDGAIYLLLEHASGGQVVRLTTP